MWELDHKESWAPKNWGFWTVVLEKTLASPLDCEEIKPVIPKGNQPWIFTGRTKAEWSWSPNTLVSWCKESTHLKRPLCWEKNKGKRRRDQKRMRWLHSITDSMDINLSRLWETAEDRGAWHALVHGVTKIWTQLSDWTTATTEPSMVHQKEVEETVLAQDPEPIQTRDLHVRSTRLILQDLPGSRRG